MILKARQNDLILEKTNEVIEAHPVRFGQIPIRECMVEGREYRVIGEGHQKCEGRKKQQVRPGVLSQ